MRVIRAAVLCEAAADESHSEVLGTGQHWQRTAILGNGEPRVKPHVWEVDFKKTQPAYEHTDYTRALMALAEEIEKLEEKP